MSEIQLCLWANQTCQFLRNEQNCSEFFDVDKITIQDIKQARGLQPDQTPKELTKALSQTFPSDPDNSALCRFLKGYLVTVKHLSEAAPNYPQVFSTYNTQCY